jgi:threonyl-tRNA synthetase
MVQSTSSMVLGAALMDHYPERVYPLSTKYETRDGSVFSDVVVKTVNDAIHRVSEKEFPAIATRIARIIKEKHVIEYACMERDVALELFSKNPLKLAILERLPYAHLHVYRLGDYFDVPHHPPFWSSSYLAAHTLLATSATFLPHQPTSSQDVSRLHHIGFTSKQEATKHAQDLEQAQQRDHRLIGQTQKLFMFHPSSPGSPFLLPHGTRIVNRMMALMRSEFTQRGYQEVITPLLYRQELWQQSGHWDNYKNDMFTVTGQHESSDHQEQYGLKPMNCPGHCLIYSSQPRSYKELPLRYADFGALHRYEASGALSGLTRIRRFHQDDAHIFCRPTQIYDEIAANLDFLDHLYKHVFKFPSYSLALSTRPKEHYIGTLDEWKAAEDALTQALEHSGQAWTLNEGDGAFYGPKIDVMVHDALGRRHQLATLQLDMQLPTRFDLWYTSESGEERPVIIHRAIYGSVERMLAILIEHYRGKWPFWLSPRQVMILPVGQSDYATRVQQHLQTVFRQVGQELYVDMDVRDLSLSRKIRDATLLHYNYVVVLGDKEHQHDTVAYRSTKEQGKVLLTDFTALLTHHVNNFE